MTNTLTAAGVCLTASNAPPALGGLMGIDAVTGSIAGTKPFSDLLSSIQIKTFSGDALVIRAPYDREATFSEALEMCKAGPHVRFMEAPGLGHRRIITDQSVFDAIRAFASEKSQSAAA